MLTKNKHEIKLSAYVTKFQKSGQWRKNKKFIHNKFIRKKLRQPNYFLLFSFKKTKVINLSSFL